MDDIHNVLNLSMEQTRWILKRIVDGENQLVADIAFANPMQLIDVILCAATMLKALETLHPESVGGLFAKGLPN